MTPPETVVGFESPSLRAKGEEGDDAYELKFLVDEPVAQEVEGWAGRRLTLDPHGDPALGGAYRTTSLYFDTPELDVFHRAQGFKRRKYRARRYGDLDWVFLERKNKWGDRVAKRRTPVPQAELPFLAHPMALTTWPGHWYHRQLTARRLAPACRVAYQRTAYAGDCPESPLRVTLDRRVRGILADDWSVAPFDGGLPILTGKVIMELKYRAALPVPFKELVADLRLSPAPVSKYRQVRLAWGAAPRREAVDA